MEVQVDTMNFRFSTLNFQKRITLFLAFAIFFVFLTQTTQATALRKAPNNLNLVGYWSLNDNGGTKATDSSGNGNTGTLTNGPTWGAGKYGSGVVFDGVNDSLVVGNGSSLQTTGNITISAWIKLAGQPALDTNAYQIVAKDKDTGGRAYAFDYYNLTGNRHLRFYINGGAGANKLEGTTTLTTGVWYHVSATYSTGGVITLYINGVQEAQSSGADASIPSASANVTIGAREYSGFEDYFNGSIDDVRIYGRTLTAAQVLDLYSSGAISHKQSDKLSLVGHWTFDENGGTVATDFSGRGNSGTLTNGPTFVAGKLGKALSLDGTDDYVDVGSSASLAPSTLSVSFWTKNNSNPASLDGLMCKTNGTTGSQGWGFYYNSASVIRFFVQGWNTNFAFSTISATRWNHVVGTWDGSTIRIYVNGVEGTSGTYSGSITTSNPLEFGRFGSNSFNIAGLIDDVRIYSRVLTADQVLSLYNARSTSVNTSQNNRVTSGLVGLWSFNGEDLIGTTAYDRAGSSNGTLTSGASATIGRVGQGIKLDGVDDYVALGDTLALNGVQARTIATWLKFSSDPLTSAQWIIERGNATNATYWLWWNGDNSYSLGDNTLICGQRISNGSGEQVANTWTPSANTWYHVACSYDGSQLVEYINGVQLGSAGSASGSVADETSTPRNLEFGRRTSTGGNLLVGSLDEVRIYNRALSASEVLQLYNQGK